MEFLSRSAVGDAPLVAFGGSDGVIRVLSMITWKVWNFIDLSLLTSISVLYYDGAHFFAACSKVHWRS